LTAAPVVIADTSPINYLILIGHDAVLPVLFGKVILPTVVRDELARPKAPVAVREWIADPPDWLEVRPAAQGNDVSLAGLDDGERAAILLADGAPCRSAPHGRAPRRENRAQQRVQGSRKARHSRDGFAARPPQPSRLPLTG
jgi:hypothetical protein